jgi:hypothetical protein
MGPYSSEWLNSEIVQKQIATKIGGGMFKSTMR